MSEESQAARYRPTEQRRPEARRVSEVVVTRFPHVYEVDPSIMGRHFAQQDMPPWDTFRIVAARRAHLRDIQSQWAQTVLIAGQASDLERLAGPDETHPRSRLGA